jgi:hypothetical protein
VHRHAPPPHTHTNTHARCATPHTHTHQEYQDLLGTFKRQELLLYQYCEEKVTLAHHALDLVTQQQKDLERVRGSAVQCVRCSALGSGVACVTVECVHVQSRAVGLRACASVCVRWCGLTPR